MDFDICLRRGRVKRVACNKIRASSLFSSSMQAIKTARDIKLTSESLKTIQSKKVNFSLCLIKSQTNPCL